jgi:site-specific DNA-methyltransferase (adenine-specific)
MQSIVECCDCMDFMAKFPDKFFELCVCDPPYGIGEFDQKPRTKKPYNRKWKIDWNQKPPTKEYFEELYRVSKNQIIWGSNYYIGCIKDVGAIIWDKGNFSGIGSDCEIASQSFDVRVIKYYLQNIGFIGPEKGQKIHPCQKPVALYKWLLQNYAKPGYKILDTHLGSQSSRIAAYQMGFDFWGCEIDPEYFEAGCKRFKKESAQEMLFQNLQQEKAEQQNLFGEV